MNKAVFLDRDGTINVEKEYLYKIDDFEYLPGAVDGLKRLQALGYLLIVVTNQSGIARGYYSEADYHHLDRWMKDDLAKQGVKITASYYCPHLPNALVKKYAVECDCRKPGLGMYNQAIKEWNIDVDSSIAIGDKIRDLAICKESKCKGVIFSDSKDSIPDSIQCFADWKDFSEHMDSVVAI